NSTRRIDRAVVRRVSGSRSNYRGADQRFARSTVLALEAAGPVVGIAAEAVFARDLHGPFERERRRVAVGFARGRLALLAEALVRGRRCAGSRRFVRRGL